MRAAVGREFRRLTSFPISANEIRRWAVALDYPATPPPLFWDEAYAATTRHGGLVAPEDFNPFAWMVADPRPDVGVAAERPWPEPELGLPDPPSRAFIINGLEVDYTGVRMRPGDVIRSTVALLGYTEREGKLGLMLHTTTEDRWLNQHDEVIRTSRIKLIRYR